MIKIELDGEESRWKTAYFSEVCTFCIHMIDDIKRTCKAFPNGIPREIWMGENNHTTPYLGDNGIRFESIKKKEKDKKEPKP